MTRNHVPFSEKTLALAVLAALLTTACSILPQPTHSVTVATPTYDPTVSARIRFLSGNGTGSAAFRPGESCYKDSYLQDEKRVDVNDGFLASWKYSSNSVTIGMPQSPRPYMRVDGLSFKDLIKEYVVPAAKPVTVRLSLNPQSFSCTPPAVTFVPEPGRDYDVFMQTAGNRCWVAARRIDDQGADESIRLELAQKCPTAPAPNN